MTALAEARVASNGNNICASTRQVSIGPATVTASSPMYRHVITTPDCIQLVGQHNNGDWDPVEGHRPAGT